MGTLRACALVALSALAACGSDGKSNIDAMIILEDAAIDAPPDAAIPDAPSYDFSCMNDPAPATADADVTIGGSVQEVILNGITPEVQPAQDATVDACTGDCVGPNLLDTQGPTGATGTFTSAAIPTGGAPLDGYIRATKTGNRTTYVYPPAPLTTSFPNAPVLMFNATAFTTIVQFLGVTQEMDNGTLGVAFTDCSNLPIGDTANLVLSVKQGGVDVTGTEVFDASQLDPSAGGTFLIFNVPPGVTEVGATYNGMALRAHEVGVVATSTTTTIVRPGY